MLESSYERFRERHAPPSMTGATKLVLMRPGKHRKVLGPRRRALSFRETTSYSPVTFTRRD